MNRRVSLGRLYLDLIRDGADVHGCHADEYDRQVFRALVRSAMSAAQCGQQLDEWIVLVCESISVLGQQAKRAGGRRDRTDRERDRVLLDAWATAERRIAERPTMTTQDRADHIAQVRAFCADADAKITDSERGALHAACDLAEKYGTIRPALPWRKIAELSGLGERATKNALASLRRKQLLVLYRRGCGAAEQNAERRRANVYCLPDAEALASHSGVPYTPRGLTYGTPSARSQTYGTPQLEPAHPDSSKEPTVAVIVTITAEDPETIAATLDALRRDRALAVQPVESGRPHLTVVPGGVPDDEPPAVGRKVRR